jgi:DNA-binding response OmpR family regulator
MQQRRISVLSVSPCADDHEAIADIMPWPIHRAASLAVAMQLLRRRQISVVVCERDLPPHSWKDLLTEVSALPKPPLVIVTSRHADEYLWAEALNLGASDVLAKPFDAGELKRTLFVAGLNWQSKHEPQLRVMARAASA